MLVAPSRSVNELKHQYHVVFMCKRTDRKQRRTREKSKSMTMRTQEIVPGATRGSATRACIETSCRFFPLDSIDPHLLSESTFASLTSFRVSLRLALRETDKSGCLTLSALKNNLPVPRSDGSVGRRVIFLWSDVLLY